MSNPLLTDPHKVRALALGLADWPDDPTPMEPSPGGVPPPGRPAVDLTRPAVGTLTDSDLLLEKEVSSYQWGRSTYHDFLGRIRAIDASLEHPLAVDEMRSYVLRMVIAYS